MLHKRNIEDIRQIGAYRIGNESLSETRCLKTTFALSFSVLQAHRRDADRLETARGL